MRENGSIMKKKLFCCVLGLLLIAGGAVAALNLFGLTDFELSTDGWWALFIIVPSLYGLVTEASKISSLGFLSLGVYLLLAARDIISYSFALKLFVPTVIVLLGVKLIIKAFVGSKRGATEVNGFNFDVKPCEENAFSKSLGRIAAVFGGNDCNLNDRELADRNFLELLCVFGGIELKVPENVELELNVFTLFGGISDERKTASSAEKTVKLTLNGFCLFGGVDIK